MKIDRIALVTNAANALKPVVAEMPVIEVESEQPRPFSPQFEKLESLRAGDRISFFGDSITASGGYLDRIEQALRRWPSKHVAVIRRGVSGAKSTDIRDGVKNLFGQNQETFAALLEKDRPSIVVIMIGINDIWHGETGNGPKTYEKAMRDLVASSGKRRLVLCTPTVIGERVDGTNVDDQKLDAYSEIVRKIAKEHEATLCDTRRAFIRAISERNKDNRESGVLTSDGVHPLPAGDDLLAETIAEAIGLAASENFPV